MNYVPVKLRTVSRDGRIISTRDRMLLDYPCNMPAHELARILHGSINRNYCTKSVWIEARDGTIVYINVMH